MTTERSTGFVAGGLCAALLVLHATAGATDIPGVLPVAFDQPQINAALVRSGDTPLTDQVFEDFNFKAILDTGASGVVIDPFYADPFIGFDLQSYSYGGNTVVFSDVALGGSVDYNLSESLELRLAPFGPPVDINNPATFTTVYDHSAGPGRLQIGPIGAVNFSPISVIGMPAMVGKVVVVDPKPVDSWLLGVAPINFISTYIYAPGTPFNPGSSSTDPGIPATERHVQLTLMDASRFTQTAPDPDPGPPYPGMETAMLADNPFIGPNPLAAIDGDVVAGTTPGVTIARGPLQATGSFLLDTGAAFSFISQATASQVNIRYRAGTFGTSSPLLEEFDPGNPAAQGTALADQFTLDVSGIGGAVTVAGFQLDSLLVRTIEGDASDPADPSHLRFVGASVAVYDVTVVDPDPDPGDGDTLTLDGIFGMNMLVASAVVDLSNPLNPVILDARLSPFDWLVFDQPNARLGVSFGPSVDDDADDDGIRDGLDICPLHVDPDQADLDSDGTGNVCDPDVDGDGESNEVDADDDDDGVPDGSDNCPVHVNPGQADMDGDGAGNVCDPDVDGDGQSNIVDGDDDNDGLLDGYEIDNSLDYRDPDSDGDGIIDGLDRDPSLGSNAGDCATMGAVVFDDTPVTAPVTCAASISIHVDPGVEVQSTGDLELISPTVGLGSGISVDGAGKLSIISADPAVPAPP